MDTTACRYWVAAALTILFFQNLFTPRAVATATASVQTSAEISGDVQLAPSNVFASSYEPVDGLPRYAVDGHASTRWAASGLGQNLTLDWGTRKTVRQLRLGFYQGATRIYKFAVFSSDDNQSYTSAGNFKSSGRTSDLEPLIRAITDVAEGVYDGLTLGAEATYAAEGVEGQLRYDPMSMRPFLSYPEGAYAAHWLRIIDSAREKPIFAHVNWFQRDHTDGHFLWPGYRDNLRPLLWLLRLKDGDVTGRRTPVGILPTPDELDLDGVQVAPDDLEVLLSIDVDRWRQEMGFREEHLAQFADLPEEIWAAHRRVAHDLDQAAGD